MTAPQPQFIRIPIPGEQMSNAERTVAALERIADALERMLEPLPPVVEPAKCGRCGGKGEFSPGAICQQCMGSGLA